MRIDTPVWNSFSVGCSATTVSLESGHDDYLNPASTVYDPSEDTFLVLDALQLDLERMICDRLCVTPSLLSEPRSLLVIELGSGAGLLIAAVAKALSSGELPVNVGVHCVAVDFNPAACRATAETCQLNDVQVDVVCGDLLTWMRQPIATSNKNEVLYGSIDVLLFNPPYVRGPGGEPARTPLSIQIDHKPEDYITHNKLLTSLADAAWLGGGPDGVDVLKKALHQAADQLSERGIFYVVMIDYNYSALVRDEMLARSERNKDQTISQENSTDILLLTTFGSDPLNTPLACIKILSRRIIGERLAVYRIYRPRI